MLQEVNATEFIPLEVDVLAGWLDQWDKQWTYPVYEGARLLFDEVDFSEGWLVDEECHFEFQILGQLIDELDEVVGVLAEFVFKWFFDSLVQFHWQAVLFVNTIEQDDSFVELLILHIVRVQKASHCTRSSSKPNHPQEFQKYCKHLFYLISPWNVSVTNCCEWGHDEVEGDQILIGTIIIYVVGVHPSTLVVLE